MRVGKPPIRGKDWCVRESCPRIWTCNVANGPYTEIQHSCHQGHGGM